MEPGKDMNVVCTPFGELFRIRERGAATREQVYALLQDLPLEVCLRHKFNIRPHAGRLMEALEVRVNGEEVELRPPADILVAAVKFRQGRPERIAGIDFSGFEESPGGGHSMRILLDRRVRELEWPSEQPMLLITIHTWPR